MNSYHSVRGKLSELDGTHYITVLEAVCRLVMRTTHAKAESFRLTAPL